MKCTTNRCGVAVAGYTKGEKKLFLAFLMNKFKEGMKKSSPKKEIFLIKHLYVGFPAFFETLGR